LPVGAGSPGFSNVEKRNVVKFLLIMPRFVRVVGETYGFPLGLAYISSALKQAGHEVHCLNLNHRSEAPGVVVEQVVREVDPDVCGTGGLTPHFDMVKGILATARRAKPSVVNIVGGGVFSSAPELVAPLLDIDFGVIGEGEETVVELAEKLTGGGEASSVDGIMFRDPEGRWLRSWPRKPIRDVDSLAWPDYDGFEFATFLDISRRFGEIRPLRPGEAHRELMMAASRSCPFACSFCFHPTGRIYRERGLDAFFAELDFLLGKYEFDILSVCDELFAVKEERLVEFCDRIKPYGIGWAAQLRVSIATDDIIRRMKDANCMLVSYGLESADETVLKSMDKKTTREEMEKALALTYDHKMEIQGNFIFGDSAETLETANNTLGWWARHRKYQINLIHLQVMRGSPLYGKAVESGRIKDPAAQLQERLINVTTMDDTTYLRIYDRIRVLYETILEPARIISFEWQGETHPTRGPLHRIEWSCPRCGAVNENLDVAVDQPRNYQSFRFACQACRSRFDIQNLARRPVEHGEADEKYRKAVALRDAGDIRSAMGAYREIVNLQFPFGMPDRPDAYVMASHDIGNLFLAMSRSAAGSWVRNAAFWHGKALLLRAFAPAYHIAYANALLAEGSVDGARLHLAQALKLLPPHDPQGGVVGEVLAGLPETGEGGPTYIV